MSVVACAMAAATLGGCIHRQPYYTPERLERGLVIVLPGIEGRSPFNDAICKGLDEGGVDWAIKVHDWTSNLGPLYNLRAEVANRRKAQELGWQIAKYHWDHPNRPVGLVGQSGGAAMAIWTAESLKPGHEVDGIVLLAASISPGYPLQYALANSKRGMVSFYSSRDWMLLGLGTTVTGTMDGRHTSSAGQYGFEQQPPELMRETGYDHLYQIPWRPEMAKTGNPGLHLTSGADLFVATYVAPLVLAPRWNEEFINRIGKSEQPPDPWQSVSRPAAPPAASSRPPAPPASVRPPAPAASSRPVFDPPALKKLPADGR